jgi:hypothetical protein
VCSIAVRARPAATAREAAQRDRPRSDTGPHFLAGMIQVSCLNTPVSRLSCFGVGAIPQVGEIDVAGVVLWYAAVCWPILEHVLGSK